MYKILVCGGRDFSDLKHMFSVLDYIHAKYKITCVVNGGAPGADSLACAWATRNNVAESVHRADWDMHGKRAGPIRNQLMLELHPDIVAVIAFPGGAGTKDMTDRARAAGFPVFESEKILKLL